MVIGKHLDFDVAGRGDVFFEQHAAGAERRLALTARRFQRGLEVGVPFDQAQPTATASRRRLDQHGIAGLVGLLLEEFRILTFTVIAGHDRHAGLLHQRLGAILEAHGADRARRRPDERDAGLRTGIGKIGVLGQKTIAGVDAFGARALGDLDQPGDREVAVARVGSAEQMGFIADAAMQRACVSGRIHTDGSDTKPLGGARDAAGNLAAIGDEYGAEHQHIRAGLRAASNGAK